MRKPENPLTLADRARDAGDWALAARHYHEALARNPDHAEIWVQYGHALKEERNLAAAEAAYRRSLELDARIADTHLQLGHVLKMQSRTEEAAAAYFRALALERPLSPAAGELLALCWEPIARLEADWRRHSPALLDGLANWRRHAPAMLNCVASVSAVAHEQARLAREIEALRREVDALAGRPDRPARTNGEAPAVAHALPERE